MRSVARIAFLGLLVGATNAIDLSGTYDEYNPAGAVDAHGIVVEQEGTSISAKCSCTWKAAKGGVISSDGSRIAGMVFAGRVALGANVTLPANGTTDARITWDNGAVWTASVPTPAPAPTPEPAPTPAPAPTPTPRTADIVVFGDSWGTEGRGAFERMAARHNLTVANKAVGGTLAAQWALKGDEIKKTLQENPTARFVWLTVGGNDAIFTRSKGVPVAAAVAEIGAAVVAINSIIHSAAPDINVVQFGYDLLQLDESARCAKFGDEVLPECKPVDANDTQRECANSQFASLQSELETIAKPFKRYTVVNLLGTLQAGANYTGAAIGHPVLTRYSPKQYMQDNCIHANDAGYDLIFAALWDAYFAKHV